MVFGWKNPVCLLAVGSLLFLASSGASSTAGKCHYVDCDCQHLETRISSPEHVEHCTRVENEIREQCQNGYSSVDRLSCDLSTSGPGAWPNGKTPRPSPLLRTEKLLRDFCAEIQSDNERPRAPYWRAIYKISPLGNEVPALHALVQTAVLRVQTAEALDNIQRADFLIDPTSPVDAKNAHWSAVELLRGNSSIHESISIHPLLHISLLSTLRLYDLDGIRSLLGNDLETVSFLNWILELKNENLSAEEMDALYKQEQELHRSDFFSSLPGDWNGFLVPPLLHLIEEHEKWGGNVYSSTRDLLDTIGTALPNRKIDGTRYAQISQRLRSLSNYTPWTANGTRLFLKEWGARGSVYDQVIRALIDDPEIATGGLPAYCHSPDTDDKKNPVQGHP